MFNASPLISFEKVFSVLALLLYLSRVLTGSGITNSNMNFIFLLLCALLGMYYMLSAGNFLMFYLGLELSSLPLAALVILILTGLDLRSRYQDDSFLSLCKLYVTVRYFIAV